MEQESDPANKRAKTENSLCLIHHSSESLTAPIVKLKDFSSWETLLNAARIHNHQPILELAQTLEPDTIPNLTYHAKCRKLFTMKKTLESVNKRKSDDVTSEELGRKSIREPGTSSLVYEKICIICMKNKYIKGSHSRESLIECVTLESDRTLREAAVSKMDSRLIAAMSRDAVASEAYFHRSCYRVYTKSTTCTSTESSLTEEEKEEVDYSQVESVAFEKVCEFIRSDIIPKARAIELTALRNMMVSHISSMGNYSITQSTKSNFLRKLKTV